MRGISGGEVEFENDQYDARLRLNNSPTQHYQGVQFLDMTRGALVYTITIFSNESMLVARLFDDPRWDRNPWALLLALTGIYSYYKIRDWMPIKHIMRYIRTPFEDVINEPTPLSLMLHSAVEGLRVGGKSREEITAALIALRGLRPYVHNEKLLGLFDRKELLLMSAIL